LAKLTQVLSACIGSFNAHEIDYLIVGGFAVAHHGHPRYTPGLDLFIRPDHPTLTRVLEALSAFGFTIPVVDEPHRVFSIGQPPTRVDIFTSLDGVSFDAAWANRVPDLICGLHVAFIGLDDLLTTKRAADRPQDVADIAGLQIPR